MQVHQFAVGEIVLYAEHRFPNLLWEADYTIVSLLSAGEREPQYQIQSTDLPFARVVGEHELSRKPVPDEARRRLDGRSLASCAPDHPGVLRKAPIS